MRATAADLKVEALRKERELEAERLWWSEAAERQVKELESTFSSEFENTTKWFRGELDACYSKLERLMEAEVKQVHAQLADLRRGTDEQGAALAELAQRLDAGPKPVPAAGAQNGGGGLAGGGLPTSEAFRLTGIEAALADLRRDLEAQREERLASAPPEETPHNAAWEQHVRELRTDLGMLRDRADLQARSNEEVQTLHQVITQSMSELSRSMESVSSVAAATERQLKQNIEEVRCELEAADVKGRAEMLGALEASTARFAQSVDDERERRATEANVLRVRLDALSEQFEDLHASAGKAGPALPTHMPPDLSTDVEALRSTLEVTRHQVSRLECSWPDGGAQALRDLIAEARQCTEQRAGELSTALRERTERLEGTVAQQLAEGLAGVRSWCAEQLVGLRRLVEDAALHTQPLVPEPASAEDATQRLEAAAAAARTAWELGPLRAEVAELKQAVQAAPAGFPKAAGLALGARVDLLQGQFQERAVAEASRLDGLDARILQAAQHADVEHLRGALQRLEQELRPLAARVDIAETESKRVARELRPLVARADAAESEMRRLLRDSRSLKDHLSEALVTPAQVGANPAPGALVPSEARLVTALPVQEQASPLGLSDDLKKSMGNLLQRVHQTLMSSNEPSGLNSSHGLDTSGGQQDVKHALQAVRALREHNLLLREENADIMEELIAQRTYSSRSGSVQGLEWTPSAQQSVCGTPLCPEAQTAQPPGCLTGAVSEQMTPSTTGGGEGLAAAAAAALLPSLGAPPPPSAAAAVATSVAAPTGAQPQGAVLAAVCGTKVVPAAAGACVGAGATTPSASAMPFGARTGGTGMRSASPGSLQPPVPSAKSMVRASVQVPSTVSQAGNLVHATPAGLSARISAAPRAVSPEGHWPTHFVGGGASACTSVASGAGGLAPRPVLGGGGSAAGSPGGVPVAATERLHHFALRQHASAQG